MCLVKMKTEIEPDAEPPRRVTVLRPVSSHSHERIAVLRPVATARSSGPRISYVEPAPRPVQYIDALSSENHLSPTTTHSRHTSVPQIVYAQPPPRSRPRSTDRVEVIGVTISPRSSRGSVRSRRSAHSHGGHSIHGSRTRLEEDVRYITRREAEERGSNRFLSASHSPPEVIDSFGYVEAPRERLYLEEGGTTTRSITYATNPRISRERMLVEENGRRRETYRERS